MTVFKKQDYIVASLSKLNHKKWEFYVITRVFHILNDLEIEFVCQQPVFHQEKSAFRMRLLDLYFPQLGLCLEVNESYHNKDEQKIKDEKRKKSILERRRKQVGVKDVTPLQIIPLNIFSEDTDRDRSIIEINQDIDEFVKLVRLKKHELKENFQSWDYEYSFKPERFIKKGILNVDEHPTFLYQHSALKCFGFTGKGWQAAVWPTNDELGYQVWFVRLVPHKMWQNSLNNDGTLLTETLLSASLADEQKQLLNDRGTEKAIFARSKDDLGRTLYRFIGRFRLKKGPIRDCKNRLTWEYKRIASFINLPKPTDRHGF
jgi:hypothetical protein